MEIRAAEISNIIKEQIANFGAEAEVAEVGQVISVGDEKERFETAKSQIESRQQFSGSN